MRLTALWNGVKKTAASPLSRRAALWICGLWLLWLTLPLIAMCFYAYPAYDDFTHTEPAVMAYAGTGDLWQTVSAAVQRTVYQYNTWQGTFVAMFFSSFQPMVFSMRLFFLTPLAVLLLLWGMLALFCHALCRDILGMSKTRTLVFYTLCMTLLMAFLKGMRESVYWLSGAPYTLGAAALLGAAAALLKLCGKPKRSWLWAVLLVLCSVTSGGCPYPLALAGLVGCGCFLVWSLMRKSPSRFYAILSFLVMLGALVAVLLSPGNQVRQIRVGEPMSPVKAVIQSVAECLETTGKWCGLQLAAVLCVMVPVLWKPLRESRCSFRYPFFITLFSFGTLAAAFVPPIFATGVEGYAVDRIISSLYMLYVPICMVNLLYWLGWIAKRFPGVRMPACHAGQLVLALVFLVWGLFANAIMTSPPLSATLSLVRGEAAAYSRELIERESAMAWAATAEEMDAAVKPLTAQPDLLYRDRVGDTGIGYRNSMAQTFRAHDAAEKYGAGRIPKEVWEEEVLFAAE